MACSPKVRKRIIDITETHEKEQGILEIYEFAPNSCPLNNNMKKKRKTVLTSILNEDKAVIIVSPAQVRYEALGREWMVECKKIFEKIVPANIAELFQTMAHFVQEESGSGVCISAKYILTCAHCVVETAEDKAMRKNVRAQPRGLNLTKTLMLGNNSFVIARCVKIDEVVDLALMEIEGDCIEATKFPIVSASACGKSGIFCCGNPSEFDLENDDENATISFVPPIFHTSSGRITGKTSTDGLALGLGTTRHTAWTYWGHSGAPLINRKGELCGIHNSWDETKGTRHAVSAGEIAAFLKGVSL